MFKIHKSVTALIVMSFAADKLIVFFTTTSNLYVVSSDDLSFKQVLGNVTVLNRARGNSVVISTYYNGGFDQNLVHLRPLVNQSTVSLPLSQAAIVPSLCVGISVLCYCSLYLSHYIEHLSLFPMILRVCGDSTHVPTNFHMYILQLC